MMSIMTFFLKTLLKFFYWAGFLAADGCISVRKKFNNKNLILRLGQKDLDHLKLFKESIGSDHPIRKQTIKNSLKNPKWNDRDVYIITVGSKKIVEDLERFNIVPKKTLTYKFPNWVANHELVSHFMRGYFDGDGTISKLANKDYFRLGIAGTQDFVETYKKMISSKLDINELFLKMEIYLF